MSYGWKSSDNIVSNTSNIGNFFLLWEEDGMHCDIFTDASLDDESYIGEMVIAGSGSEIEINDITIYESDKGHGTQLIKDLFDFGVTEITGESLEDAEYFWGRFCDLSEDTVDGFRPFVITKESFQERYIKGLR